jgi:hypothetical protein
MVAFVAAAAEPADIQRFCVIVVVSLGVELGAAHFTGLTLEPSACYRGGNDVAGPLALWAELGGMLSAVVALVLAVAVARAKHASARPTFRGFSANLAITCCHASPDPMTPLKHGFTRLSSDALPNNRRKLQAGHISADSGLRDLVALFADCIDDGAYQGAFCGL